MTHAPTPSRADIERYIDEVWNQHDPDALDRLVTPSYRRHLGPLHDSIGAADQKARIRMFQRAFPDLRFEIQSILVEGDRGMFHVVVRGTHLSELMGVPATGASVVVEALDVVRLQDGKIAEHWGVVDLMGLHQQLKAAASDLGADADA